MLELSQRVQYMEAPCAAQPGVQFYDALCPCVCVLKLIPGMRPDILEYLIGEGYEVVPVSQILLDGEYTIDHEGRQWAAE